MLVTSRNYSMQHSRNGNSVVTEACFVICYPVRFLIDMVNGIEYLYVWLDRHPDD